MTNTNLHGGLVAKYLERLSADFEVTPSDTGCFVLTPFIRPDGEAIELELDTLPNGRVRLGDMGDTLGYLFVNGLTLSQTVMDYAKRISMSYGVSLQRDTLSIEVEQPAMGDAFHYLIQAVLAVTDLIQTRDTTNRVRFDKEAESLRTRVTEQGLLIPKDFLQGVEEVDIQIRDGLIVVVPVTDSNPLSALAKDPIYLDIEDASVNHDKYIY